MPRNFKEALLFTCLMCGLMVSGMSLWNLWVLDWIGVAAFSWHHFFTGFLPGFVVAFLLDMILVGPLAKVIAFRILHLLKAHDKRWAKILAISGTMVLFMVTCMSLYGLLYNAQTITPAAYGRAWLTNIVFALPLNFLVAGPISRFILGRLQKTLPGEDVVEDFDDDDELPTII
ncbi:DUF2798 domain-containing protein [Streptococcus dentapri]|uniref:DUF2798 domain-containing protein n=1 Tax=Streptococcus dentapri TaxID=573564 RepID=A0ABV8CYN1_9STRE